LKSRKKTNYFRRSKENIIEFLGLNEQAQKFGLGLSYNNMGSFNLKFYRLTKINGKAENYAISTQQHLELELPLLLGSDGESKLNSVCMHLLRFAIFRSSCHQAPVFVGLYTGKVTLSYWMLQNTGF